MPISQFYFAWVNSTETEFSEAHMREDELMFSFELTHQEGDIPELELEIINPHIGLLAPGRPLWCWLSWTNGTDVWPLFFGRLFSVPDDLFAEIITVKFVAKPKNFLAIQMEVADDLKVLPFYDPLFFDKGVAEEGTPEEADPNKVLEGYSKLWHVDRVDHSVTVSDIIAGEDGVEEFGADEVFYDSVQIRIAGAPVIVSEVEGTVRWVQCDHTGVFEMKTQAKVEEDPAAKEAREGYEMTLRNQYGPLPGDPPTSIAFEKEEYPTITKTYKNPNPHPADGDLMEETETWTGPQMFSGITIEYKYEETPGNPETGQGREVKESRTTKDVISVDIETTAPEEPEEQDLEVQVEVQQTRNEVLHVRLVADLQPVLGEATEDDGIKESSSMNAQDPVEFGVLTTSDGAYFPTARGLQSVEFLLMVARAKLLSGSRVVETTWEVPFERAVEAELSLRKNATLADSRLPGGTVLGKIVEYKLSGNGDDGEFLGEITIKSCVGKGNAIVTAPGVPVYVGEGYVTVGYQHYDGQIIAATTSDTTFPALAYQAVGIQLPVTIDQVLVRHEYYNGGADQMVRDLLQYYQTPSLDGLGYMGPSGMMQAASSEQQLNEAISRTIYDNPSWVELEFKPVQKISTDIEYDAESILVLPMQINLAAPSTP